MSEDVTARIMRMAEQIRAQRTGVQAPPTAATQPEQSFARQALGVVTAPFRFFQEAVLEPLASVAAAPIVPDLKPLPGESFFERKRREYEMWDAPRGAKFGLELLVDPLNILLPGSGLVRKGLTAVGLKAAGKVVAEKAALTPMKAKIALSMKAAFGLRKEVKAAIKAGRGQRLPGQQEAAREAIEQGKSLEDILKAAKGEGGEFARPQIERLNLLDDEAKEMMIEVFDYTKSNLKHFDRITAGDAFSKIMVGAAPTPHDLRILGKALKIEVPEVMNLTNWEKALSFLNLPRALLASFDISFPLRQGIMLVGHPVQFAQMWKPMIKAFGSRKAFDASIESIKLSEPRLFDKFIKKGLNLTDLGEQEEFLTPLANKLIGLKESQRGFITAGNELRWRVAYKTAKNWEAAMAKGINIPDEQWDILVNFLNYATGKGSLGSFQKYAASFNAVLFAPLYTISRPQAFYQLFRGGRVTTEVVEGVTLKGAALWGQATPVRKLIAKDLAAFVGTGVTALSLLRLAGAEVELDPRSSDFGKYKIGNTRGEFWGGFQQIARYTAQLMTGQRKKTGTGEIVGIDRTDVVFRFLQSKLSPTAGLTVDILKGETFIGEELRGEAEFVGEQIFNRMAPLFIQDMIEAVDDQGYIGGFAALPGVAGVGVNTFSDIRGVQDFVAKKQFGTLYSELNLGEKRLVNDADEVKAAKDEMEMRGGGIDIETQQKNAFQFHAQRKTELEAGLRENIDAGADGPALKDFIQEFNRAVNNSSETVFTDDILALGDKPSELPIEDILGERYWFTNIEQDKMTGALDYRTWQQTRAEVVREAQRLGVSVEYVTGRGPGNFYDKRVADPVVKDVVTRYSEDMQKLQPYFGIRDQVFDMIGSTYGQQGIDIWNRYHREDALGHNTVTKQMRLRYPFISKANSLIRQMKLQMRGQNPEIDALVMRWYGAATIGR